LTRTDLVLIIGWRGFLLVPITYRIDSQQSLILTEATGALSVAEMRAHYQRVAEDPDFRLEYASLIDFSRADSLRASGEEVRGLARLIPSVRGARRAIVVNSDLHYGLGRMVSLTRSPELEIEVFRTRTEAFAWLGACDS